MALAETAGELYRRSATLDDEGHVQERVFRVWRYDTDTGQVAQMSSLEVLDTLLAETGVTIGSTFPGADGLVCNRLAPEENESGDSEWMWDVVASYAVPDEESQPEDFEEFMQRSNGGGADDPTNPFGPERSGGGQIMDEYWFEDLDGKKFVLPTGFPFQNTPPQPVTIQIDRITVSERTPAKTSRIGLCDGNMMLANVSYEEQTHVNRTTGTRTKYYRNSYERWTHPYRPFSKVKLLCYGFQAFYMRQGKKVLDNCRINDDDPQSEFVAEPQPLTNTGFRKQAGQLPDLIEFRIRHEGPLLIPFM